MTLTPISTTLAMLSSSMTYLTVSLIAAAATIWPRRFDLFYEEVAPTPISSKSENTEEVNQSNQHKTAQFMGAAFGILVVAPYLGGGGASCCSSYGYS